MMNHPWFRTVFVTVRTWAIVGLALGVGIGLVAAARNGFHSVPDVIRLLAALGATFALLLGSTGFAAGGLALLPRMRVPSGAPFAFASAVATTTFLWAARAFEFDLAYPARWSFVHGFGGMLAFSSACL